ncbi:MAG: energy transducer TonB [Muribaculum sp.]|nr:energy transducer TonB [Muribaculum sp.]
METKHNKSLRQLAVAMLTPALMLAASIVLAPGAKAQTFRVSTGVSPTGARCYMEVFEYDFVEEKPGFPGGDTKLTEYINTTRHYPREAYRKGIQGRVTCSFVVNADGSVSHVRVIRSASPQLDEEAVRIFKSMPTWQPGRISGQAVPVRVIRSVPFRK